PARPFGTPFLTVAVSDTLIVDNLPVDSQEMNVAQLSEILKQATGVVAARGEGVLLYDEDDRRYLDFTAGIGVTSTGHCHPRVVEAAQRQVGTLIHGQTRRCCTAHCLPWSSGWATCCAGPGPDVLREFRQRAIEAA